jgi:hypothetical protein
MGSGELGELGSGLASSQARFGVGKERSPRPAAHPPHARCRRSRLRPMATVAGAVAEAVGVSLQHFSGSAIVENGGDCYLNLREETSVGIFAGPRSPFTGKIALKLAPDRFPLGVCTSSATVGPSLSFGNARRDRPIAQHGPGRCRRHPPGQPGKNRIRT